jgi:hypothetical protein
MWPRLRSRGKLERYPELAPPPQGFNVAAASQPRKALGGDNCFYVTVSGFNVAAASQPRKVRLRNFISQNSSENILRAVAMWGGKRES